MLQNYPTRLMNQWIEQHRTLILSIVGLLLVSAITLFAIRLKTPAPISIEPPQPTRLLPPPERLNEGAGLVPVAGHGSGPRLHRPVNQLAHHGAAVAVYPLLDPRVQPCHLLGWHQNQDPLVFQG